MRLPGSCALPAAGDSLKNAPGYRTFWNIWLDSMEMDSLFIKSSSGELGMLNPWSPHVPALQIGLNRGKQFRLAGV